MQILQAIPIASSHEPRQAERPLPEGASSFSEHLESTTALEREDAGKEAVVVGSPKRLRSDADDENTRDEAQPPEKITAKTDRRRDALPPEERKNDEEKVDSVVAEAAPRPELTQTAREKATPRESVAGDERVNGESGIRNASADPAVELSPNENSKTSDAVPIEISRDSDVTVDETVIVEHNLDRIHKDPLGSDSVVSRAPESAAGSIAPIQSRESTSADSRDRRRENSGDRRVGRLPPRNSGEATSARHTIDGGTGASTNIAIDSEISEQGEARVSEIIVDLGAEQSDDFPHGLESPGAGRSESPIHTAIRGTVQSQLGRRLNGDLGQSIVRQARVLLRDNNRGEIRLIIRPPELGRVRINLQMDNGHIAGRILVDNGSVREVFEQNLAALERAFAEAGIELGELEIGTGSDGGDKTAGDRSADRQLGRERFAEQVETIVKYDFGDRRVNIVA